MTKRTSTPKTSDYMQRRSGGRTGRPRVPKTDRKKPLVSIKVQPGKTPAHGVSGYPTTGIAGGFNDGYSTPGVYTGNVNIAASRYSVQANDARLNPYGGMGYNFATPAPPIRSNMNTVSNFTSEPLDARRVSFGEASAIGLGRSQVLQATGGHERGSLLEERAYQGYGQDDLFLNAALPSIDENRSIHPSPEDVLTPQRPIRLNFSPVTAPRQDMQHSGTINHTGFVTPVQPQGRSDLHAINASHTPAVVGAGYSAAGTHMGHGPVPHQQFDGSWTIDVMPGEEPITLQDLPPPAPIPVQTYSGYAPQNSSAAYMRPSGGSFLSPSLQKIALFA
jgi:hypothetical protein